jgi:hypothetical protein
MNSDRPFQRPATSVPIAAPGGPRVEHRFGGGGEGAPVRSVALGLALLTLAAQPLLAQRTTPAFGLPIGASVASLEAAGVRLDTTSERFVFVTDSVPAPAPWVERYYLTITPGAGLCKVLGQGWIHEDDSTGASLRASFNVVRLGLEMVPRYGQGERIDYLQDGARWTAPGQWMMSVTAGERALGEIWPADSTSSLSSDVRSMLLRVNAASADAGWVSLSYEGKNFPSCAAEMGDPSNPGT